MPYFFALIMFFMHLFHKMYGVMANSVHPDQTAASGAVYSGYGLFAYAILFGKLVIEILGHLPYC